jgi:NodT family efflux transporter outer membrane factor (OMF) lipoprotein
MQDNLAQWWTNFKDPMLNQLIAEAIAGNLSLKQAEIRIREARANRGIAASAFWPQISQSNTETYSRSVTPGTTTPLATVANFFQTGFDATWEFDIFGGTRRAVEAATANIDAAIENRRDTLVTLLAEVATDYITYRGYQLELKIARDNVVAQEKSVVVTKQKHEGGLVTGLDVANAQALVATTQAAIPPLETSAQQTLYSLAVLLGREPAALDEQLKASAPIPPPPPAVPVGLPSTLLRRRPDIRSAEAQIHAATANIGVAEADFFPKLSLTGAAGVEGSKAPSLVKWASRFWNIGPTLDWQAFSGFRISSNVRLQKALTEESVIVYQQAVLTALQDVDNALVAYAKEKEHRKALADSVTANQRAVDLSIELYAQGKTDFLNVVTAEKSLYDAQDALAQSDRSLSVDIVALYKALGGGWSPDDLQNTASAPPAAGTPISEVVEPPAPMQEAKRE